MVSLKHHKIEDRVGFLMGRQQILEEIRFSLFSTIFHQWKVAETPINPMVKTSYGCLGVLQMLGIQ